MRYFFLAIGVLAASLVWAHRPEDKDEIKRQLAAVPGYSIMPNSGF